LSLFTVVYRAQVRLLQSGANHAARDKSTGNQALHCAAQAGRTEICKKLVEAGASIDDQVTISNAL